MNYRLCVPAVAEDVEEIRVLEWHGGEGDRFAPGQLIVEFETHKALVEVRAGQSGVLERILTGAGEWARIGEPIALLADDVGSGEAAIEAGDFPVEFLVD